MLKRRRGRVGGQVIGAVQGEPVIADVQCAGDSITDDTARACNGGSSTAAPMARKDQHGRCGRQQSTGPRAVEPGNPNGARTRHLTPKQASDKESGDDEEDVDADEPAAEPHAR